MVLAGAIRILVAFVSKTHLGSYSTLSSSWRARGLLFENCSCQLLCPAHISFKQTCNGDRCRGYWALHIDDGEFGDISLSGLNIVILFDAPARMYSGDWTQVFYIDHLADKLQHTALETIFSGKAGGPWTILNRFVSEQLESRIVPIHFEDHGKKKHLFVPEFLESTVVAIRGHDDENDATISNLHNVIHGPAHILSRGRTKSTDRAFTFTNQDTHGLYSKFDWKVST